MKSFWVDFPLNEKQYAKLDLRWRRRKNYYEIKNTPPALRIRTFCTFGGDDIKIISLEVRGDINDYNNTLKVMNQWIIESLGEY
jgi:hypothetical protein